MKKYLSILWLFSCALFAEQIIPSAQLEVENSSVVSDEAVHAFLEQLDILANKVLEGEKGSIILANTNFDQLRDLVECGFNPLRTIDDGRTFVHAAAMEGCVDVLNLFLENSNGTIPRDVEGNTPVHLAMEHKRAVALGFLYGKGFDFTLKNDAGRVPFEQARELLAEAIALKDDNSNFDQIITNPLMLAARIHVGSDINAQNEKGKTLAFLYAETPTSNEEVRAVAKEIFWLLIELGADFKKEDFSGNSMSKSVASYYINKAREAGELPLHKAYREGDFDTLALLLSVGLADLAEQDVEGNTIAHLAANKGDWETLAHLINDDNYLIKNNAGKTVLEELYRGLGKEVY